MPVVSYPRMLLLKAFTQKTQYAYCCCGTAYACDFTSVEMFAEYGYSDYCREQYGAYVVDTVECAGRQVFQSVHGAKCYEMVEHAETQTAGNAFPFDAEGPFAFACRIVDYRTDECRRKEHGFENRVVGGVCSVRLDDMLRGFHAYPYKAYRKEYGYGQQYILDALAISLTNQPDEFQPRDGR